MTATGEPAPRLLPTGWWTGALRPDERPDAVPAWVAPVEQAVLVAPAEPTDPGPSTGSGAATLAPALAPFVTAATMRLVARQTTGDDTVPADVAPATLLTTLRDRLTRTAARTLVLELSRSAGPRHEDGRDRFTDFLAHTATAAGLGALVTAHPVLARLLGQICLQEVDALVELLERFATDRPALVAGLLHGVDPGPVTLVTVGAGDRHGGGRSVAVLQFASGARLVYKPRPVTMLVRFAELLAVLEDEVPGLAPRAPLALARDGYGWVEFVPRRACADRPEVERFYRRQGALLALLHSLEATDAHCENIIACGDHPVLVDVETLLHPTPRPAGPAGDDPALRAISASVQRTALLPRPVFGELGALDLSGLGGGAGDLAPDPVARWADAGTDRMHLVREPARLPGGYAGPTVNGAPVDVRRHVGELLAGFHAAYDVIRDNATELLAPDGAIGRCGAETTRFVVRDTAFYGRLLDESTHPDLLRCPGERERVLADVLADEAPEPALVPHELRDLWAGDIPLFTVRPDGHAVSDAEGRPVPARVDEPVLDRVRRKITDMGATDRERQEWMIRATLALAEGPTAHRSAAAARRVGCEPAGTDRLLAAACAVGDQVVALAEHDQHRANWVGMERLDDRFWTVLPLGAGLGEGYPGVALFLAELGSVTGIGRYTDLARRAVTPLPWLVATLADPQRAAAVGCGAFTGIGGICYALARLSPMLPDQGLAALLPDALAAAAHAARLSHAGTGTERGVGTGSRGGVAALRAVHAETGLGADALDALLCTVPTGPQARDDGTGWCSGPAGAVAALLDAGADPDAELVARATAGGPLAEHSLCHGEAGVLDVLVELGEPARAARLDRSAQLLAALAGDGPRCSTPAGLPTPGLLTGLSGVGHTLLRLARPADVPSVLRLRPARSVTPPTPAVPPGTAVPCTARPSADLRSVLVRSCSPTLEER